MTHFDEFRTILSDERISLRQLRLADSVCQEVLERRTELQKVAEVTRVKLGSLGAVVILLIGPRVVRVVEHCTRIVSVENELLKILSMASSLRMTTLHSAPELSLLVSEHASSAVA